MEVASNFRPSKSLAECSTQEQSTLKFRRTFSQSTIREAARVLGVSERSVYGYLEQERLARVRIEDTTMLLAEEVAAFQRRPPGRARTISPRWCLPPEQNPMYLTTICVRLRPGCARLLEEAFAEFRATGKHYLLGTSMRYVGRNRDDPEEIVMMLVWRGADMPPADQRDQALKAFSADLAEMLDWSTADITEGQVLLHAG